MTETAVSTRLRYAHNHNMNVPSRKTEFSIGQRLSYGGDLCTIRYVGAVHGTKGDWLGVEWDDTSRGKHDGQSGGKRYFTCGF